MTVTDTSHPPTAAADPLLLTVPATVGQRFAAVALDVALVALVAAVGVACLVLGATGAGILLLAVAVTVAVVVVVVTARTGRSPGRMAVGIRTVETTSAAPAGVGILAALFGGRLGAFDLRRGRDPLAAALAPFTFSAVTAATPVIPRRDRHRTAVATLDSGQRLVLDAVLLIGRNPTAPPDAPSPVFEWPDLSRTLSKNHARIEWDGTQSWITDLGSTNGTALRLSDGSTRPLVPFQRTPLEPAATLSLGDRLLTVAVDA